MPEADSSSVLGDPRAAQVILGAERRWLEPFMGRERSVSAAARELGVAVDALSYRVRRFVKLGLLTFVREEPRGGRAIKIYRGRAHYRLPLAVLPAVDLLELAERLDAPMRSRYLAGFAGSLEHTDFYEWAVVCYRTADDPVRLELVPPLSGWTPEQLMRPEVPALLFNWVPLALSPEQAKTLQAELMQLVGHYQTHLSDVPTHLFGLFLAPEPK